MPCFACDGSGTSYVICDECTGPDPNCETCNGTGEYAIPCWVCGGTANPVG